MKSSIWKNQLSVAISIEFRINGTKLFLHIYYSYICYFQRTQINNFTKLITLNNFVVIVPFVNELPQSFVDNQRSETAKLYLVLQDVFQPWGKLDQTAQVVYEVRKTNVGPNWGPIQISWKENQSEKWENNTSSSQSNSIFHRDNHGRSRTSQIYSTRRSFISAMRANNFPLIDTE